MKKVMIAVDGGVLSEKTAEKGYELARAMGAMVALVYVVDPSGGMGDSGISDKEWVEQARQEGRYMLERLKREAGDENAWTFVEAGSAARTILRLAAEWEADVLVISTHGRRGVSHMLMGSVAEHIIRHAEVPVLVVPAKR